MVDKNALTGIRVLELDNGLAQYAGKILADMGADVIKIEPPGGAPTRKAAPFYKEEFDINKSLYFWNYNTSKRSMVLELSETKDVEKFVKLAGTADIILDGMGYNVLKSYNIDYNNLLNQYPNLIYCSITPFGIDGPWAHFKSSDIVQMAMGGTMSICGYDDEDLPPVAPTGGQSGHMTGVIAATSILAAIVHRQENNEGQFVDVSAHEALSFTTEFDKPFWEFQQTNMIRQTGRHAFHAVRPRWNHRCSDGKYLVAHTTYIDKKRFRELVKWFDSKGLAEDLTDEKYEDDTFRRENLAHVVDVIGRFCAHFPSDYIFHEAQQQRLPWAPVNYPFELVDDPHLSIDRQMFVEVNHDDIEDTILYPGAPYKLSRTKWGINKRPPSLGEHTDQVLDEIT